MSRTVVLVCVGVLLLAIRPTGASHLSLAEWICGTVLDGRLPVMNDVAPQLPVWVEQTPPILTTDYTGSVAFTLTYSGDVAHLRVFYVRPGDVWAYDELPRLETRTIGGILVSVFRPMWTMKEFVSRFGFSINEDSGGSDGVRIAPASVPIGSDGLAVQYAVFTIRTMGRSFGSVPVFRVDDTAQYSSHVINLVLPELGDTLGLDRFNPAVAARRLYAYLGDDYDQVAFVFQDRPLYPPNLGAYHVTVKNRISGIGLGLSDNSGAYGSAGRLHGVDVYLVGLSNGLSNHELSHQWGHAFDWEAIAGVRSSNRVHTPLWGFFESPLSVHLHEAQRLLPAGPVDAWYRQWAPEPTRIPPLQAYAMGRLAATDVPPVTLFDDQFQTVPNSGAFTARTRTVTMNQIVAIHGQRQGPVVDALRRATVLLSRERLASQAEMDYWTLRAQRMEDPYHTGLISWQGIGSFKAISGVQLDTALVLPRLLTGHAAVEPATVHPKDILGVTFDRPIPLTVPTPGVVRISGRLNEPTLRPSDQIVVAIGGKGFRSSVAQDGTFSVLAPFAGSSGYRANFSVYFEIGPHFKTLSAVYNSRVVNAAAAPAAPVELRNSVLGRNVSLQWSPDTGTTPNSYFVDVGSSPGASDIGTFPTTSAAMAASDVPDGRYYVRVRARNAWGVSTPSSETTVVVACAPQAPGPLTSEVSGGSVSLSWVPSQSPAIRYVVVAGSGPMRGDIAQIYVGAATSLHAVAPPGRYFVRVRAVSSCGGFAESNEVEVAVGLPVAPANLVAAVNGNSVSLTWNAPAGTITGYVLEAGSGTGLSNLASLRLGPASSYRVSGVPVGTYYVRVRAFNLAGLSPPSNELRLTVP